ncbi:MAG: VOC family protein [Flavobacteriales bacterium]|nr:VOC family protein [Flavobacteriales bacterium]
MESLFHLAFPVKDLNKTKEFYVDFLGCSTGRTTTNWMDINFFGHQLTAQVNPEAVTQQAFYNNEKFPFPPHHFGIVLSWKNWHQLHDKLISKKVVFLIEPEVVFEGEVGEQKTMFIRDPDGYFIEFKTFEDLNNVFKAEVN